MENNTDKIVWTTTKPCSQSKKRVRVVASLVPWKSNITPEVLNEQLTKIKELNELCDTTNTIQDNVLHLIQSHIQQKRRGYKYQDIHNSLYDETRFIPFPKIVALLASSQLTCYYCQQSVQLLYEYVREPLQWTLERLDNQQGHNTDNVVIACLRCNVRRRTMYHERFLYTKQINQQKIIKE
jgi:hypothetical protein